MMRTSFAIIFGRRPGGRRAGFTLMELVVTVALLGIAMGLLFVPLNSIFGYFRSGTARADAYNAARIGLDAMCRELEEAMYVQLDMYDNSVVAFVPPLRVNPSDPTSEVVTPPRPDWNRAIRYWRALHDPTVNYSAEATLGPPNTYYLARTVVDDPFNITDPWNRWNADWAAQQSSGGAQGLTNWSPIPRAVNMDIDSLGGPRTTTLQPGYPYLYIKWSQANGEPLPDAPARVYRDLVVALTPNALGYDVTGLEFQPLVVSGEWLTPAGGADGDDYTVYHTKYPLLRLGAPYTGWSSFSGGQEAIPLPASARAWARDPFLLIWRINPDTGLYELRAVGCFDPRSRTMRVLDASDGTPIYDTGDYPYRLPPLAEGSPSIALGTGLNGWIEGAFRFDFPPPLTAAEMADGAPMHVAGADLTLVPLAVGDPVYELPLLSVWNLHTPGDPLSYFLVPDSVRVRVDSDGDGKPDRALTQVSCTPRSGLDQFQVGLDFLATGGPDSDQPKYGFIRLPERLADGQLASDHDLWVDFRWRSNGVWIKNDEHPEGHEYPDLICAYYRSAAVLDVSITVTRSDSGARGPSKVAQVAHLTRRVKLHNALREISYGSR